MPLTFRALRYVRRTVSDLDATAHFATEMFGLMPEDRSDTECHFRADSRFYSLCLSTQLPPAIGLSVATEEDLDAYADWLDAQGHIVERLEGDAAQRRWIKRGLAVAGPGGVVLEIVWRHMESGRPYHGARHTGLIGFAAVQLACADIDAAAAFWAGLPGVEASDFAGAAQFLQLDEGHHQIALYPSANTGLLGAIWTVDSVDNVMRHWHHLRDRQVAIAHGPGRQPTSRAAFVTVRDPEAFLMTYATAMDQAPADGPRQFRAEPLSHCDWGSPTDQPEFTGEMP